MMKILASSIGLLACLGAAPAKAEFYVNPFAGMMMFDSTVTVGGIKLVDQGGDAPMGGLRVGWINPNSGFHYGAELEGFAASGRSRAYISADRAAGGVADIYSRSVSAGMAAFARVGWRTRGNAIMFLRPGVMYINTSMGWEIAPAIGAAAEIPFATNWAARVDVTYAWTGAMEYYTGTIGVVWRFGP